MFFKTYIFNLRRILTSKPGRICLMIMYIVMAGVVLFAFFSYASTIKGLRLATDLVQESSDVVVVDSLEVVDVHMWVRTLPNTDLCVIDDSICAVPVSVREISELWIFTATTIAPFALVTLLLQIDSHRQCGSRSVTLLCFLTTCIVAVLCTFLPIRGINPWLDAVGAVIAMSLGLYTILYTNRV